MKLPTREFAEVIECLMGPKDKLGANEKRRATRYTISARVDVYLLADGRDGRTFSGLLRDISMTGVGLLQSVVLPAGQKLVLALPRANGPLFVEGVVMNCRLLADGLLAVGADFTRLLEDKEGQQLRSKQTAELARLQSAVLS